ncbi:MAG TPA: Fe(2+)-trafficking protein [Phycisphaerales bacterium]|nr:Fe(2+)-trafficking protein [Phycisphaerales bacterium]
MDTEAVNRRIAQFETMVRPGADPENDMAWFSLGGAYAQAGRHADAARAYLRCVEINPGMSKAWQLAGQALADAGERGRAVETLTRGYLSAAGKGDRLPQKAMGELLTGLGAPVPEIAKKETQAPLGEGSVVDHKTGRVGARLARPPMRGPVGAWIYGHVSAETWDAWIRQGTKVINELRLDLSRDEDSEAYDRHMYEFLGIDEEMLAAIRAGSAV